MYTDKHDKIGTHGFNVPPEQLAHDLTMLKLYKSSEINSESNEDVIYNAYVETLIYFTAIVEDKIRYDSNFNE